MCIIIRGTPARATVSSISGSNIPPDTSFTACAPAATAASATAARRVSTLMVKGRMALLSPHVPPPSAERAVGVPVATAAAVAACMPFMIGTTREISSSSETSVAPGL